MLVMSCTSQLRKGASLFFRLNINAFEASMAGTSEALRMFQPTLWDFLHFQDEEMHTHIRVGEINALNNTNMYIMFIYHYKKKQWIVRTLTVSPLTT